MNRTVFSLPEHSEYRTASGLAITVAKDVSDAATKAVRLAGGRVKR